jgi:hypothetical protein
MDVVIPVDGSQPEVENMHEDMQEDWHNRRYKEVKE